MFTRGQTSEECWNKSPPKQRQPVKTIDKLNNENYQILVLPGGVKAMEKVRQEKRL